MEEEPCESYNEVGNGACHLFSVPSLALEHDGEFYSFTLSFVYRHQVWTDVISSLILENSLMDFEDSIAQETKERGKACDIIYV